jgi:hypothetical protein
MFKKISKGFIGIYNSHNYFFATLIVLFKMIHSSWKWHKINVTNCCICKSILMSLYNEVAGRFVEFFRL